MKRTQALAQNHAARPQHQQQLQPFGMPTGIPPAPNQQQQYDTNQAHIPSAFPNMGGIPNGNPNQPATLQSRPGGAQNIHVQRQLDPMNMVHPQNGPIKFTQQQLLNMREQQRQQQQQFQSGGMNNHSSPADIFSSPGMSNELLRRPSPHPGNPQQVPPVQGSQPQQLPMVGPNGARVPISPQEVAQRINILKNQMASQEQMLKQLQIQHANVKGTPQEGPLVARVKELTNEYNKRRDYVQRFTQSYDTFRCVPLQIDSFFVLFCFFC